MAISITHYDFSGKDTVESLKEHTFSGEKPSSVTFVGRQEAYTPVGEEQKYYDVYNLVYFVGRVINEREHNGYDDSDFYALVLDSENRFRWIEYGTTRFACNSSSSIDATPEVRANYKAWVAENVARQKAQLDLYSAARPDIGKRVRVNGGRKYPGLIGTLKWIGDAQHGYHTTRNGRYGILPDEPERWGIEPKKYAFVDAHLVNVIDENGEDVFYEGIVEAHRVSVDGWAYTPGYVFAAGIA